MNSTQLQNLNTTDRRADSSRRKPYSAPVLTSFGRVVDLTQGQSGCNQNDSAWCTPGISNMGPKP